MSTRIGFIRYCSGKCIVFLRKSGFIFLTGCLAIVSSEHWVLAQIKPDTTLGAESSVVTTNANVKGFPAEFIEGGALRDINLFHSFLEFNVEQLQRVYFANPVGIENILTRVTGGSSSEIMGTLGVDGGANLYLLNPNGIIFGKTAQLDVTGSFIASTANSIEFDDGSLFSATNPEPASLLTVSVPLGLQYGANPSGVITNRGNLSVGKDLTLAGGDLDLQGQLSAEGNLTLQATDKAQIRDDPVHPFVASAGKEFLIEGGQAVDIFALHHPGSWLFSGGDMVLRSANAVRGDLHSWSGGNFQIEHLDGSLGDLLSPDDLVIRTSGDVSFHSYTGVSLQILAAGSVYVPGTITITGTNTTANSTQENVTLSNGATIFINGNTQPTLDIRAGTTAFNPNGVNPPNFPAFISADENVMRADITIGIIGVRDEPNGLVLLTNQDQPNRLSGNILVSKIDTSSTIGGDVIIDSGNNLVIKNHINSSSVFINPNSNNMGDAGNIILMSQDTISLNGLGSGLIGQINSQRIGDGGNIVILTEELRVTNKAQLRTSNFGNQGNAGHILINARDVFFESGNAFTTVEKNGDGDSSNIIINTDRFAVTGTAQLKTSNLGTGNAGDIVINAQSSVLFDAEGRCGLGDDCGAFAKVEGTRIGRGGQIIIKTKSLQLLNGASLTTSTFNQGNAGHINIDASEEVLLNSQATVRTTVEKKGRGQGGDISINTPFLSLRDKSALLASTLGTGNAGKITIVAPKQVLLDGSVAISGVEPDAVGNGGSRGIDIMTDILTINNGGLISTKTFGLGNAGNIEITANETAFNNGNAFTRVQAGAEGNGGNLNIWTGSLSLNNSQLLADSLEEGIAGNIILNISDSFWANDSEIATAAAKSSGGEIEITAWDMFFTGDSDIRTNVFSGEGGGGNITLNAGSIVAFDDSDIFSFARDGKGGDITFNTPALFLENSSPTLPGIDPATLDGNNRADINASGAINGTITQPDVTPVTNNLSELPENPIDTDALLNNSCIVRTEGRQGNFTITGSGNLPTAPGNVATSSYPTGEVQALPQVDTHISEPMEELVFETTEKHKFGDGELTMGRPCS